MGIKPTEEENYFQGTAGYDEAIGKKAGVG